MNTKPKTGQAWEQHLATERDWYCPEHGYVTSGGRVHGGRGRAHNCGHDGCSRTVKSTNVDWDAYWEAFRNHNYPPCPACGGNSTSTVPAKPKYVCDGCSHSFGTAGGYY